MKGVRLRPFEYSQKRIIHIKQENKIIADSIKAVKSMNKGEAVSKRWIEDPRDKVDDAMTFWEGDSVRRLPKVGPAYERKLHLFGIYKIEDISAITDNLLELVCQTTGIPHATVKQFLPLAEQAKAGDYPFLEKDHRVAPNPFESQYGRDWESYIYKSEHFRDMISIKSLVRHIDQETKRVFQGTQYEDTYMWSHDALSQMMDPTCLKWMEEEGILHRWLRPVLGVNDVVTVLDEDGKVRKSRRYGGRPTGDSPELMPNDNSLFRDLRCALDLNTALTFHLPRDDPRRFSKATPKEISRAILRLWEHNSPRPERIVQDIACLPTAIEKIIEFEGGIVPGLADRNGWRKQTRSVIKKRIYHGPKTDGNPPKTFDEMGIHPDVSDVAKELVEKEKRKFDKYLKTLEGDSKDVEDGELKIN